MGQGGRHYRQPDGAFLGGGGGVFPGVPRSGHAPVLPLLHAVGPLWHLSFSGLPHSRGIVFQGQPGNSAYTQGPVYPTLGGPGTQPLQRYLEVQHPRREVLRRKSPTSTKPSLLGRGGVFSPHRGAILQVLRRGYRVPRAGPDRALRDGKGKGGIPLYVPGPDRWELARGQELPGGGSESLFGHRGESAWPVSPSGGAARQGRAS